MELLDVEPSGLAGSLPARTPTSFVIDRVGQVVNTMRGRLRPELWDEIAELVLN